VLAGVLVVVLLAGIGLAVTWIVRQRADDRQSAGGVPGPSASQAVRAATITTFSAAACLGTASADAPTVPQPGAKRDDDGLVLTSGWHYYADPTGFKVAVPDTWTYERVGTTICFRDPLGGRFLSIDPKRNPNGDPMTACQTEAAKVAKTKALPQYHMVGITEQSAVIKAADWEYTFETPSNTPMRAVTRWFKSKGQAYAMTWAVRDFDWLQNVPVRSMIISSFSAPPVQPSHPSGG
jgi:hypothetical protein